MVDNTKGKVIIVTGANRGLGLALVQRLVQLPDHPTVIFTARNEESRKSTTEKILSAHPDFKGSLYSHDLELASSDSIKKFCSWVEEKFGKFDVLVNNIGIQQPWDQVKYSVFGVPGAENYFPELKLAQDILDVNYHKTKELTYKLLPLLASNGKIMTISSGLGLWTIQGTKIYEMLNKPEHQDKDLDAIIDKFEESIKNKDFDGVTKSPYNLSKALINAWNRDILPKKLTGDQQCYSIWPGWCRTDLGSSLAPMSADEGTHTTLFLLDLPFKRDDTYHGKSIDEKKVADLHQIPKFDLSKIADQL